MYIGIISLRIYYDIDINNMEKCYRVIILARSMLKLLVILMQLYQGENKLIFNDMIMRSILF
jgi:hypothetical protein